MIMVGRRYIIGRFREILYSVLLWRKFRRYFAEIKKNPPKKVIYTTICGNYDCLNLNVFLNTAYQYVCFTDSVSYLRKKTVGPWIIKPLPYTKMDMARNSRYPKLHPHKLFPEFEESIYVDANLYFKDDKLFAAAEALSKRSDVFLAIPPHHSTSCIYDELDDCLICQRDSEDVLMRHKAFLEKEGFPRQLGLSENNVIYRKHHQVMCMKIMEDWWRMLERYSRRDQLSLFYVLWKNNQTMTYLLDTPIKHDKASFRIYHHNNHGRRK